MMKHWSVSRKKILLIGGVILVAGLLIYMSQNKQSAPDLQTESLKTALIQNLIILDSANFINVASPSSAQEHKVLRDTLDQSIKDIESKLSGQVKEIAEIKQALEAEKDVLSSYTSNLTALEKILAYNPTDDLDTEREELSKRAGAAKSGIQAVLDESTKNSDLNLNSDQLQLSDGARQSLEKARDCFDRLSQSQIDKSDCIKLYDTARQSVSKSLINTLNTSGIQSIKQQFRQILERIPNQ